jgi:hypothetical protein
MVIATASALVACSSCEAGLPCNCQLCPRCATQLEAEETLELNPVLVLPDPNITPAPAREHLPAAVHRTHRRPLGIHPVPLLGAHRGRLVWSPELPVRSIRNARHAEVLNRRSRASETDAGRGCGRRSAAERSNKEPQHPVSGPVLEKGVEDRKPLQMAI